MTPNVSSNTRSYGKKILLGLAMLVLILLICPIPIAQAAEETVEIGIPVEEHPELFIPRGMPTHGEGKIAVFLIEFPDYKNDDPGATREHIDKLYFSGEENSTWGYKSVAQFYKEQSYGKLNLSGQVFDWYTAKHERSYYDNRKAELIMEAAEHYRAQGVDFSDFDGDGDGTIDAISFHFAGPDSAERHSAWYAGVCHSSDSQGQIDGLNFKNIVQVSADQKIHTISHELMHTLGMPDLYGEVYFSLNPTHDLMSANENTVSPYIKMLLGWVDNVKVVTEDTNDIRLDVYNESSDQVVLVTDAYNGIFDEFYLVAYRYLHGYYTAVVWHIDARLNEDGTCFVNQNLYYDPRPDKKTGHNDGYISPGLFVEELCADPSHNMVLVGQMPSGVSTSGFGPDSVLGPNAMPSSDTHDGEYTGLRLDNFTEHFTFDAVNKDVVIDRYLTFDVSFVEDTDAPVLKSDKDDLTFQQTITLNFNEPVYMGDRWSDLRVLDPEGNPLEATVILPHYPKNQLEITFKNEDYRDGYSIVLPENCLKDSSGNGTSAVTLTLKPTNQLYPVETNQLPSVVGHLRDNAVAYFYPLDNELLVITGCWATLNGEHTPDVKIEFMHLDLNGNVLSQIIVDNPVAEGHLNNFILDVYQTTDGNYIFWYRTHDLRYFAFCMDANGQLLWQCDLRLSDEPTAEPYFVDSTDEGLIVCFTIKTSAQELQQYTLLRASDGTLSEISEETADAQTKQLIDFHKEWISYYTLPDQSYMRFSQRDGAFWIELLEPESLNHMAKTSIPVTGSIYAIWQNKDGTIFIAIAPFGSDSIELFLFDAKLNLIHNRTQKKANISHILGRIIPLDDGFVDVEFVLQGNHTDCQFHVRRYDRNLNLVWETYVEGNFVYYFKSPTGEIMAYRSTLGPVRECYIDRYGSEADFLAEFAHTHSLIHVEAAETTCTTSGHRDYWYCTDCGGCFADEGSTPITSVITAPATGHTPEEIPEIPAGCLTDGWSAGSKCSVCDTILEEPVLLSARGYHIYDVWVTKEAATCAKEGEEMRLCLFCDAKETRTLYKTNDHEFSQWITIKEPTCSDYGVLSHECTICGLTETDTKALPPNPKAHTFDTGTVTAKPTCAEPGTRTYTCQHCKAQKTEPIPANENHNYGAWMVIDAATCTEAGTEARTCNTCEKKVTREVSATGDHDYGAWLVTKEATTESEGEKTRTCLHCNATEVQSTEKLPPETGNDPNKDPDVGGKDDGQDGGGKDGDNNIAIVAIACGAAAIFCGVAIPLLRRKKK